MEKYSKWNDDATGINPFTPEVNKTKTLQYLLLLPLVLVKLLCLCVIIPSCIVLSIFFSLIPMYIVRRFCERYVSFVFCFVLLKVFNFYYFVETNFTRNDNSLSSYQKNIFWKIYSHIVQSPHRQDIIISNYVSYFQVLYFGMTCSPQFVTLVKHPTKPFVFRVKSHSHWLKFLFNEYLLKRNYDYHDECQSLSTLINENSIGYNPKPMVLFIEGASSNGKSLLKFKSSTLLNAIRKEAKMRRFRIMGFKFRYLNFSPSFYFEKISLKYFIFHIWNSLSQFYNVMEICEYKDEKFFKEKDLDQQVLKFEKKMKLITRLKSVQLGMKDKEDFLRYWVKTDKKDYVK